MFISQINRSFTFNQKTWLMSVANRPDEGHEIPGATIFIEGVLLHKLLFARYDIEVQILPSKQENAPNVGAYLKRITCFETDRYKGGLEHTESLTYPASPKACDTLNQYIRRVATYLDNPRGKTTDRPIQIQHNAIRWCFNL